MLTCAMLTGGQTVAEGWTVEVPIIVEVTLGPDVLVRVTVLVDVVAVPGVPVAHCAWLNITRRPLFVSPPVPLQEYWVY